MKKQSLHSILHSKENESMDSVILSKDNKKNKKLIVEIPHEAHYQIDKMRLELRRDSIKSLVIESLNDLFIKHGYPPIA